MSDQTIRNVSELEKALESSFTPQRSRRLNLAPSRISSPAPESPSTVYTPSSDENYFSQAEVTPKPSSKERTGTHQYSTNHLLMNLGGLQTTTNTKLDVLTDAIFRMTKAVETLTIEQRKHTELLARIVSNTAEPRVVADNSSSTRKPTKQLVHKCKDYGFSEGANVISEFIMNILKQAEIQIKARGKGYNSSRTLDRVTMDKVVKILADIDYRIGGENKPKVSIPSTSSEACIYLASRIGSLDSVKPILTPFAIVELLNDPGCRTMTSALKEIVTRIPAISWMLPYYEADIVSSLMYPYFDNDGHILCNWTMLNPRDETADESKIFSIGVQKRKILATQVLNGIKLEKALKIVVDR